MADRLIERSQIRPVDSTNRWTSSTLAAGSGVCFELPYRPADSRSPVIRGRSAL
ncbi:MAG: hypothetical protein QOG51_253 [Verrucomicrobiota bacterium]